MEGGVARDSEALTLLDNPHTRTAILNELMEVRPAAGGPCVRRLGGPCVQRLGGPCAQRLGGPCVRRLGGPCVRRLGGPCVRRLGGPCVRRLGGTVRAATGWGGGAVKCALCRGSLASGSKTRSFPGNVMTITSWTRCALPRPLRTSTETDFSTNFSRSTLSL